jgi:hypothetical protein
VDRCQVELGDDIDDEPGEIVLRQPVAERRRHQVLLVPLDRPEVVAHGRLLLVPPHPRIVAASAFRG